VIKLRLVLHRFFLKNFKKLNHLVCSYDVAHSYLAMTHLNAEGDERIKQDYLLPLAEKLVLCVYQNL
jgi:hypothetical protein